jgi:monofunctional biosynthetic peptidoglycan transglycosylase
MARSWKIMGALCVAYLYNIFLNKTLTTSRTQAIVRIIQTGQCPENSDTEGWCDNMNLLQASLMFIPALLSPAPDSTLVFDFSRGSAADWIIVNDGVMGGLSRSEFTDTGEGYAVFRGAVSLDNNGGFASVRGLVSDGALDTSRAVVLRVRGDGRTYQVRLRTDRRFDGIAYRATFETTAGEWQDLVIPFSDFVPTFRGRTPRGAPALAPEDIRQFGLMIADKREGDFRLEIAWVEGRN